MGSGKLLGPNFVRINQVGLVGLLSVIFAGLLGLGKLRKKND